MSEELGTFVEENLNDLLNKLLFDNDYCVSFNYNRISMYIYEYSEVY